MATAASRPFLSPEQYEAIEERSEIRHEYYRGEMFAMAGATQNHNLVAGNLFGELRNSFMGRPCMVFQSDMRVKIQTTGLYTYPDVVAVCGPTLFNEEKKTTLLNPTVVVEVLSPSTELYDRTTKLDHYKTVESLREIVLVAQDRARIDLLRRVEGNWIWFSLVGLEGLLTLESIGCEIPIARIYDKVELFEGAFRRVVDEENE